jgi:hypothetical protein
MDDASWQVTREKEKSTAGRPKIRAKGDRKIEAMKE